MININDFHGKLSFGLQNQGLNSDSMDEKAFTEPFACLENHDILDSPISIKEIQEEYTTTDYFAQFDENVCSDGIKLTTHYYGGPDDDYSGECVLCNQ